MNSLISEYNRKKYQIKKRLREFKGLGNAENEDIFSELCFCILTPQSKAVNCDKAIKELRKAGLLFKGNVHEIKTKLKGLVRFHNNKAVYIIAARKFFKDGSRALDIDDPYKTRDWLVKNIKGLGYKEASHFLRNIGLGKDMAILDVHILRNLKKYNVINMIPAPFNKKSYLKLENKMKGFAQRVKIPLEELDLLLWSNQTGFIFK
ncbi:MAG: N-glycosylase/DNA lyase [Candidatus Omnitrophota bacterium]|nr:MAG: N-glycosylase/DNA lyase [Candidatus Omnitrophota bacterium]